MTREYYFNDAGAQIDRFAASLIAAATGAPPRRTATPATTSTTSPRRCRRQPGVLDAGGEADRGLPAEGIELMLASIKASLARFGVEFDVYFSEATLHENGEIDQAVDRLREQGHVYEADGAVWLRTTDFGDDKDRVLVRSDGRPTYFNADCRLLPGQAAARGRTGGLPARRRPPRLRRPDAGDRRLLRRRPGARPSRSSSASWSRCAAAG